MTRPQRAEYIQGKLDELYPEIPIPLDHTDAYTLLIAVLLSAQCTDKRVNMVTPALFAKASTPRDMARLSVDEILECIKTCGLANGKAKNIKRLSEMLIENHGGVVPQVRRPGRRHGAIHRRGHARPRHQAPGEPDDGG